MAQEHEVATELDIVFAEHDGVTLLGDLYLPKGLAKAPVLVGVHGGGWQIGDRRFYTHWGNYFARKGYAVFAIEYRLMKPGVKTWPGAVCDVKAAVQFLRAEAAEFGLDGRAHRVDRRFRWRASLRAPGPRGQRTAVLEPVSRRPPCGDLGRGEGGRRLLRRL